MSSNRTHFSLSLAVGLVLGAAPATVATDTADEAGKAEPGHRSFSGIYPHLAYFNDEGECGTGAVVPWADRLWVITYAPHRPRGSTDKLYEIDNDLNLVERPESIGGTPANRLIHEESGQLFIGPYAIDAERHVRVIPYEVMPGRHTGTARHLSDPENKVYYATMEEGFYEVDVHSLEVTELFRDTHQNEGAPLADLPGYHGKGLYSGQGLLVYANNGENSPEARRVPDIPSGSLAVWDGSSADWTVVRRNQFTEVTGPGGIRGNANPDEDPIWSVGWDHLSLLLKTMHEGEWHLWRLPKASHTYDGAHGWNTEWPRIREIGDDQEGLLMTMHGTFWHFPRDFRPGHSGGIAPRSTYLKIIGDFARWHEHVVFGCDDGARSAFLNERGPKVGTQTGQSQSNLWFVRPEQIDQLGPALGRGAVWLQQPVRADDVSDPYLFNGYHHRLLHLSHDLGREAEFVIELDLEGNGEWSGFETVEVPAGGYRWVSFDPDQAGAWIRVRSRQEIGHVNAVFHYRGKDERPVTAFGGHETDHRFLPLPDSVNAAGSGGVLRARGNNTRTLGFAASVATADGGVEPAGFYEMGGDMVLRLTDDTAAFEWTLANVPKPDGVYERDQASVIYTDEEGRRFRLPLGDGIHDAEARFGPARVVREVVTERDLFAAHGTFYELPAENAGGFSKIRPISSHQKRFDDFCTYRGLLVLSGLRADDDDGHPNVVVSDDGRVALWAGTIDDLWSFGKPAGRGGPWNGTAVSAGEWSDPYLMAGYDRKTLTLSHEHDGPVTITVQVDLTGDNHWVTYGGFEVAPGEKLEHGFDRAFEAYWVRVAADQDTEATAWLVYE